MGLLAFMAVSALAGGIMLIVGREGSDVMPVSMMDGVFASFLVPGLLLAGLGVLAAVAAWTVARRRPEAWLWCGFATVGMIVWIVVEIAILRAFHWLHVVYFVAPLIAGVLALQLVPRGRIGARTDAGSGPA